MCLDVWHNQQTHGNAEAIGPYNGNGVESVLEKCAFIDLYTCVRNGETLTITLNETSYRKQINSGRAHYWATKWTLLDGLIVR